MVYKRDMKIREENSMIFSGILFHDFFSIPCSLNRFKCRKFCYLRDDV
ncbi:hypothetical protein NGUA18_00015 [Salmonella enterica]|nr:hypothetical protein NGUA18_00015 [Salmonella enterica]